jgi:RNA polymerase sigma-70 factor, ECF subfamily
VDDKQELFWTLLEAEHPRAEAFCRKLAGNRTDGDDLYQDSLLSAMKKFDKLRLRTAFRPWLYRIMVNTYVSSRRGPWQRKRAQLTTEILDTLSAGDPSDEYAARRWLEIAMKTLSAKDRALVTLFEIEGWSVAELAELEGRPTGSIKSRLSRARQKMRQAIVRYLTNEKGEMGYALPQSQT